MTAGRQPAGTRAQRAAVASAIVLAGAGNSLSSFGERPDCGYFDGIEDLPYDLVAVITADLLRNLPGGAWDTRIPDPAPRPATGTRNA